VTPSTLRILIAVSVTALLLDLCRPSIARTGDRQHLLCGLSSGALLGAAFFVLTGQALLYSASSAGADDVLSFVGIGFTGSLILDRVWFFYRRHGNTVENMIHSVLVRCPMGVAIGAAMHTPVPGGLIVAASLLLREVALLSAATSPANLQPQPQSPTHRIASMIAMVAFLTVTALTSISSGILSIILSVAAGCCVYSGASILIPESHHAHSQGPTLAMTALGSLVIYLIVA
jgi:zinc transporter ZupT